MHNSLAKTNNFLSYGKVNIEPIKGNGASSNRIENCFFDKCDSSESKVKHKKISRSFQNNGNAMMIIENETMSPVNRNIPIIILNPEEETSRGLNIQSEIHSIRSSILSKEKLHSKSFNFTSLKESQLLKNILMAIYCIYLSFTLCFSKLILVPYLTFIYPEIPLILLSVPFSTYPKIFASISIPLLISDSLLLSLSTLSLLTFHFSLLSKLLRLLLTFHQLITAAPKD